MKKTYYLIAAIMMLLSSSILAQSPNRRGNKMNTKMDQKLLERKLAYFKENLMLTPKENVAFEKAYREFTSKKIASRKTFKTEVIDVIQEGKANDLSEREQTVLIRKKMQLDLERFNMRKDFEAELMKILPPIKVIRYFKIERQFNRELMNRFKNRKNTKGRKTSRRPRFGTPPPPPED